ncbi:hypothetical protein FAM09_02920 [Niastella caeni]|uniref:Uncharacterized protein n=1 Tax=Niastella caeni TaxID=2569763 RepID=A0A4S8HZR6_9BACT|nr:hypothetical protein [Niastella caeni]THU41085.1 hypothetical protein FAM09_02920 [Niastella caeni]
MKKSPVSFSSLLNLPRINKTLPDGFFKNQKITKQAASLSQPVVPPSEAMINYLNRIGHEYPFCVNNKQKTHDPL